MDLKRMESFIINALEDKTGLHLKIVYKFSKKRDAIGMFLINKRNESIVYHDHTDISSMILEDKEIDFVIFNDIKTTSEFLEKGYYDSQESFKMHDSIIEVGNECNHEYSLKEQSFIDSFLKSKMLIKLMNHIFIAIRRYARNNMTTESIEVSVKEYIKSVSFNGVSKAVKASDLFEEEDELENDIVNCYCKAGIKVKFTNDENDEQDEQDEIFTNYAKE